MKVLEVERKALESQTRLLFAGVVWSHKIQEKEADILFQRARRFTIAKITASAFTTSAIFSTIFCDGKVLSIVSAVLAVVTLFTTSYLETANLNERAKEHKQSALAFLKIREDALILLRHIRFGDKSFTELENEFALLLKGHQAACASMSETSNEAVKLASSALFNKKEYSYTEKEIDQFLPPELRRLEG